MLAKKFVKNQKSFDYDGFDEWGTMKNTVYEIKFDDQNKLFRCSCVHGQKWIDCKHAIGCLIKFAKFVIPETAMSVSLQTQRKTQGE